MARVVLLLEAFHFTVGAPAITNIVVQIPNMAVVIYTHDVPQASLYFYVTVWELI